MRFGIFEVDLDAGELRKSGRKVRLQEQPFQILSFLLERPGRLVTREELRKKLWSDNTFVDFDHGLNKAVNKLREALGDSAGSARFIETLPRRGYRFTAPVAASWSPTHLPESGPQQIRSLAVLPLVNLHHDPEQEYFADGMTDALIADLAKIQALRVISWTSVMQYKGTKRSLPRIAEELNVDAVVEGSVFRAENRVRITARLVEAAPDRNIWAESYEEDLRDILALQRQVARSIAEEIKIKITPEENSRLSTARAVDPEAHEDYLRGRYLWNRRRRDEVSRGLEYFEQAVRKDPSFAPAYAGIADSYSKLAYYGPLPPGEVFPKAKAAAEKAIALDDTLSEGHTSMGEVLRAYDWNWPAAEREFQRAIELKPSFVGAHQEYAEYLLNLGRHEEAIREIEHAMSLCPLSVIINTCFGYTLFFSGQHDRAVAQLQECCELDPEFWVRPYWIGRICLQRQDYDWGLKELEKANELSKENPVTLAWMGYGYAVAGRKKEASDVLAHLGELSERRYVPPFLFAIANLGLGDLEQTLEWMEAAFRERSPWMAWLKAYPELDSVRAEPRFQKLLRQVNFPG